MPRHVRIQPRKNKTYFKLLQVEALEDRTVPSFVTASTFNVGVNISGFFGQSSKPVALAVGDFNSDGKLDVVTANSNGLGLSLLRGNGLGGFLSSLNFATPAKPSIIKAADVNGDGRLDIIVGSPANDSVSIFRGNGNGTFKARSFTRPARPACIAMGDVNGDGRGPRHADSGARHRDALLGLGTGNSPGLDRHSQDNPTSVVLFDFNNDGKPDLASVGGGFDHLDVNLNNGDGTFLAKVNYVTRFNARGRRF